MPLSVFSCVTSHQLHIHITLYTLYIYRYALPIKCENNNKKRGQTAHALQLFFLLFFLFFITNTKRERKIVRGCETSQTFYVFQRMNEEWRISVSFVFVYIVYLSYQSAERQPDRAMPCHAMPCHPTSTSKWMCNAQNTSLTVSNWERGEQCL